MPAPTVPVTVTLLSSDGGTPYAGVTVRARLDINEVYEGMVISDQASAVTDVDGIAVLDLFPNAPDPTGLGTQGSTYRVWASIPGGRSLNVDARVPNTACLLENILVSDEIGALSDAELALLQAQSAVTTAAISAASATASATSATTSATSASASATSATASATAAASSASAAAASASSAGSSSSSASASAASAADSADEAAASAAVAATVSQAYVGMTRATIAALNSSLVQLAFLKEAGSEGEFVFDSTSQWDGRCVVSSHANATVTESATVNDQYLVAKPSGGSAYNSSVTSPTALTGDFEIWVQRVNFGGGGGFFIGVDAAPVSTSDYTDIDYAVDWGSGGHSAYKNGVKDTTAPGGADHLPSSALSWFCLRRVGTAITWLENSSRTLTGASTVHTFTGTASGTMYVKGLNFAQGDTYYLMVIDSVNQGAGYVQADPQQAVYIAPNSDATGASGAWVRVLDADKTIKPEWFGAAGDGTTNDTDAFYAASVLLNTWGCGTLSLATGATYIVGQQTLGGDAANFSYAPDPIIELSGFSGHIKIEGNGATMTAAAGLRIGSFDPGTGNVFNPPGGGFTDTTYMATPYEGMIRADVYTGTLEIENITLNGNEQNLTQGGYWGDTGFQVQCAGLQILPGSGKLFCRNVVSTRHGTDGGTYQATVDSRMDASVLAHFLGCEFTYAGRNSFSFTGGRGVVFENCKFNHAAKGTIQTLPQFGFDMEPDGGLYARDITFINCEFLNNESGGYGGGSGRMQEINFYDCRFSGDPATGTAGATSALFVTKPGHKFHNCKIVGIYQITASDAVKYEFREGITEEGWGPQFFSCIFTNNPNEYYGGIAPTLAGGTASVSGPVLFDNCTWDYNVTAWAITTAYLADQTVRNGSNFYRCTTAGTSAGAGGPSGTGTAITDGTVVWTYAGDIVSATSTSAGSEPYRVTYRNCRFFDYSTGSSNLGGNFEGTTMMNFSSGQPGVNLEPQYIFGRYVYNNVEQFTGSKTFDWASIAAAGVATTTVTVPLAKAGDGRTYSAVMSVGWGGLIAFCEVTADNTVTVTAFNPTAGAIDLASGTLSVVGAR